MNGFSGVPMRHFVCCLSLLATCACDTEPAPSSNTDSGVDFDASMSPDVNLPPVHDMGRDATNAGEFGDPCDENRDCISGHCIEAAEHGRICTRTCGECPPGFECNPIANDGPDRTFLCLADQPDLCKPCETDRECDDNADLCLRIGLNDYCAEDCSSDGVCPDGYECVDVDGDGDAGVVAQQCVPANGEGCQPCRDDDGDGYGDGGDCLGFDCNDGDPNVYEGATELCDDVDNNCNSLVDEPELLEPPADGIECLDQGVCRGTRVACIGGEWRCDYPESFEFGAEQSCDGLDNDCDGTPDDDIDLTSDAANCAFCGNACVFQNAAGVCFESSCELGGCDEGWHSVDGNDGNGCEYACNETQDGVEVCDQLDNDCDGTADEGFDVESDIAHCGACNRECVVANATPACREGACAIERCDAGWVDLDDDPLTGCEFACEVTNDGIEACDGNDNDCDGAVDEGYDLQTSLDHCGACDRACAFDHGSARCAEGLCDFVQCDNNYWNVNEELADGCEYECVLSRGGEEACDLVDNDCDNAIDEEFDVSSDPSHCGGCGRVCIYANGTPLCMGGECALGPCEDGWWNADGGAINGCEYRCDQTNGGVESCDLADNDCDNAIDEEFDITSDVLHCGRCNNECQLDNATPRCTAGECRISECIGGWWDINAESEDGCEYACQPTNGGLEICDRADNDCDGVIDEDAPVDADPNHCGACDRRCEYDNAAPVCQGGACSMGACEEGFQDLDGRDDNGCEYACEFIQEVDDPDGDGIDADCDGVDGDIEDSVFVAVNGDDDGNDGLTPESPVATPRRGLEIAVEANRHHVLIATGSYRSAAQLQLVEGRWLHGGYDADFRNRPNNRATLTFTSTYGLRAVGLRAPVLIDQVDVLVTNRVGSSEPAIAVALDGVGAHVTFRRSDITAGRGGNGTSGAAGGQGGVGGRGANGGGASGGGGGAGGGGAGGNGRNRNDGLPGATGAGNSCGAGGGGGGGGDDTGCNDGDPGRGGNGRDGCTGRVGNPGTGGNGVGTLQGVLWQRSNGTNGAGGGRGGGGGGGGAGGGEDCRVFGQCVFCGTGRGGGGGGGGGAGGGGGQGGTGGGASIAMLIRNGTVTLDDVLLVTVGGGNGGAGGGAGAPGAGGDGGNGATNGSNTDGNGGNGGHGGTGGGGGCGGGGGGGPSIAVWGNGGAVLTVRGELDTVVGAAGTGGPSCRAGGNGDRRDFNNVQLQ